MSTLIYMVTIKLFLLLLTLQKVMTEYKCPCHTFLLEAKYFLGSPIKPYYTFINESYLDSVEDEILSIVGSLHASGKEAMGIQKRGQESSNR